MTLTSAALSLVLQTSAIILCAWVTSWFLRPLRCPERKAIWGSALLLVLLAPITLCLGPISDADWLVLSAPSVLVPEETHNRELTMRPTNSELQPFADQPYRNPNRTPTAPLGIDLSWLGLALLTTWAIGTIYHLVTLWRGLSSVKAIVQSATFATGLIQEEVANAAKRLDLRQRPVVAISSDISVPLCTGILHPIILLPRNMIRSLKTATRRRLLEHECAHLLHRDPGLGLLQRLATSLHWFNPLVRIMNQRIDDLAEELCDNHVLSRTTSAPDYATDLLWLAEKESGTPTRGICFAVGPRNPSSFERRIHAILSTKRDRSTNLSHPSQVALLFAVLLAAALLLGCRIATEVSPKRDVPRVLYIAGQPSWEYRYLKNFLLREFESQTLLLESGKFGS